MRVLDIADCINDICPWSGKPVQADSLIERAVRIAGCERRSTFVQII